MKLYEFILTNIISTISGLFDFSLAARFSSYKNQISIVKGKIIKLYEKVLRIFFKKIFQCHYKCKLSSECILILPQKGRWYEDD